MVKLILVYLIAAGFILAAGESVKWSAFAEDTQEAIKNEAVNVGNKICPVSGEKIGSGGMKAETYEYKGKIYNFCCPMCIDEFKKDPEKYIKKVDEESKAEKDKIREEKVERNEKLFEQEQENDEMNLPEEGMHGGHHH